MGRRGEEGEKQGYKKRRRAAFPDDLQNKSLDRMIGITRDIPVIDHPED